MKKKALQVLMSELEMGIEIPLDTLARTTVHNTPYKQGKTAMLGFGQMY